MAKIAVHTVVKNGADYVGECLTAVLPYVDIVRVSVGSHSSDGTNKILRYLESRYCNLNVDYFTAPIPREDLVRVRNRQIRQSKNDDWIWVIDDDEYYPSAQIKRIVAFLRSGRHNDDAYKLPNWFLYDNDNFFTKRSVSATRIFRNHPNLEWTGDWGHERLINSSDSSRIPGYYIHFSYLKSHSWRKDFGAGYNISIDQGVQPLPIKIKKEIEKVHEKKEEREKMQNVWWEELQSSNRFWNEPIG